MKKRPQIECPKCSGEGRIALTDALFETLAALSRGKSLSASEARHLVLSVVTTSAMNNRLEELRTLGLVKRVRCGKVWKYSAA